MFFTRSRCGFLKALFLSLMALFVCLGQTASADTLDDILREQKITVGWIPYLTLTRRNLQTNQVDGYMVEVLEVIADNMGIPPENITFVETDWANFAVGLNGGKYDISIAPTFATIARASAVAFTRPLFYLGNSALVQKGDDRFSNVQSVMDLDRPDLTIAVVAGEQSHEFVERNFTQAQVKVVKAADITTGMLEVASGRADVAMADAGVVNKFARTHPDTVDLFEESPWGVQAISWAVRPGDIRLLNFLNTSIAFLDSIGTLRNIMIREEYADVPFLIPQVHPVLVR